TGTVRGNATGLPESTQTLGITVTQAVGQQVTLDFAPCEVGDRPIWFAYQDGNGPWTPLTGSNDAYTFSVASNEFAVAAATTPGAGQSIVFVAYSTQAEANTFSSEDLCDPVPTGKTVNVTVAGLDPLQGESAILSLGEADIFAFANGAAQFTNVPDGNLDLVAYRSHPTGITDRMVLVRDLNPADNGSVGTIDFATDGFAPGTADITIGGGGALTTWLIEYATSPSAGFCYYSGRLTSGSAGAQFTVPGAPPAQQQAGDYHVVTMSSLLGSSFASVSESFATLANRTVSFGGIVPAPTITDLSGSGNYRRVLAEVTLPAEYNDGVSIAVTDQGADRSISALASPGRIGGGNVSLEIPDFSGVAGWNDAWAPTSASTSDWGFSAFGWTGADCVEGAREVRSLQTGTVG
ncbi:MAG TPA: hypothetical protein VLA09_10195, partial [Longimicrobiales bacterium]|nr:hypothetical protein [Longimicrobiales bacterium]